MKVVYINSFNCGSTGNLMLSTGEYIRKKGEEFFFCCPSSRTNRKKNIKNQIFIGNRISRNIHLKLSQIIGICGVFSYVSTMLFLKKIDEIQPDIIHINNLHNGYINIPMLFNYIKRNEIATVWTMHDCWGFTAYCPHFDTVKCEKWKNGCNNCPQYRDVLSSSPYIDNSSLMWKLKRKWFLGVNNMLTVSPSRWTSNRIKESFLRDYSNKVIYNGIDITVFYPRESYFKCDNNIADKHMVLGVAFEWGYRKGLDVFERLSEIITEDYKIVLVGIDEKRAAKLPSNIICIHRTASQTKLAEIYSAADVYVNPTREEVFGLVNVEALACGTPVITFDSGGSPETIDDSCGYVVPRDDYNKLLCAIKNVCEKHPFLEENCVKRAQKFSIERMCEEYYTTYLDLVSNDHNKGENPK